MNKPNETLLNLLISLGAQIQTEIQEATKSAGSSDYSPDHEGRIEDLETHVGEIRSDLRGFERRLEDLEDQDEPSLEEMQDEIEGVRSSVEEVEGRLDDLESMEGRLDNLENMTSTEDLEQEVESLRSSLDEYDSRIEEALERGESVVDQVTNLEIDIDRLQRELDATESKAHEALEVARAAFSMSMQLFNDSRLAAREKSFLSRFFSALFFWRR